jgi:hypothetical protein
LVLGLTGSHRVSKRDEGWFPGGDLRSRKPAGRHGHGPEGWARRGWDGKSGRPVHLSQWAVG